MTDGVRVTRWPVTPVRVVNLLLDEANARLDSDSLHSQEALMWDLFHNENAFEIVQSIAEDDYFSNDLPIVTKSGERFVVLEGNRRAAALKAILNPRSVPMFRERIENLFAGRNTDDLENIDVMVARSSDDALPQLAKLHTSQPRRPWTPLRQARFFLAQIEEGKTLEQLRVAYPRIDIARFARMWQMHRIAKSIDYSDPETARIVSGPKFRITTLARVYDNEEFQKQFGIQFEPTGKVLISADKADFARAYAHVVADVAHNVVNSRTINTKSDIDEAITRWGRPKTSKSGRLISADEFHLAPPPTPTPVDGSTPSPTSAPKRRPKQLGGFPSSVSLSAPGVERRMNELRRLPFATYPNLAMDAIRTLLECSLKAYCQHVQVQVPPRKPGHAVQLSDVLKVMEQHLGTMPEHRDLVAVVSKLREDPKIAHSLMGRLQAANHNHRLLADGAEVAFVWDQICGLISFALTPPGSAS